MSEVKLCKDCKHYKLITRIGQPVCMKDASIEIDVVKGGESPLYPNEAVDCYTSRYGSRVFLGYNAIQDREVFQIIEPTCGKEAKFFEPVLDNQQEKSQ